MNVEAAVQRFVDGLRQIVAAWWTPTATIDDGVDDEIADGPAMDQIEAFVRAEAERLILATPQRVTSVPSRRITFGQSTVRADEEGSQLIGFQPNRMRITIANLNESPGDTVFVGSSEATAATTEGFPIVAGGSLTLETQSAIFVRVASGEAASVAYMIEHGD